MEVVKVLIPLALLMAAFFIAGFIWMTKKGQYDDLETPGMRMLLDEELIKKTKLDSKQSQEGEI